VKLTSLPVPELSEAELDGLVAYWEETPGDVLVVGAREDL
jgi:hypothetical protein